MLRGALIFKRVSIGECATLWAACALGRMYSRKFPDFVCSWHKADIPMDVCFEGQSGHREMSSLPSTIQFFFWRYGATQGGCQCSLVDVFVVRSVMRQKARPFTRLTAIAQFVAGRPVRHSLLGSACTQVISVSSRVSRCGSARLNKAYDRSVHDVAPNLPSSMPSLAMRST